jgi:Mlc titration factor MtfA (ptsG expression regulator)
MPYQTALLILFTTLFSIMLLVYLWRRNRHWKRMAAIDAMPFPAAWHLWLLNISHYRRLRSDERKRLERAILRFVHTKHFAGIGMDVTDEMKVITAFFACLLVRRYPDYLYPALRTVIFYTGDFVVSEHRNRGGIVSEGEVALDGQTSDDTVVLAWNEARREAYFPSGRNVVIHEFAHLLDFADGAADGLPPLPRETEAAWTRIMAREFSALEKAVERGGYPHKYRLLGEYAATDKAEFFAVATERFFERPAEFRHAFTELYDLLDTFYGPRH